MVAASLSLGKSKRPEQRAEFGEIDVGIGSPREDLLEQSRMIGHSKENGESRAALVYQHPAVQG